MRLCAKAQNKMDTTMMELVTKQNGHDHDGARNKTKQFVTIVMELVSVLRQKQNKTNLNHHHV